MTAVLGRRAVAHTPHSALMSIGQVGAVDLRIDAGSELGARCEARRILLGRLRQMVHGPG
jgi:hypothetical protein